MGQVAVTGVRGGLDICSDLSRTTIARQETSSRTRLVDVRIESPEREGPALGRQGCQNPSFLTRQRLFKLDAEPQPLHTSFLTAWFVMESVNIEYDK
jgi:hypothetical protein